MRSTVAALRAQSDDLKEKTNQPQFRKSLGLEATLRQRIAELAEVSEDCKVLTAQERQTSKRIQEIKAQQVDHSSPACTALTSEHRVCARDHGAASCVWRVGNCNHHRSRPAPCLAQLPSQLCFAETSSKPVFRIDTWALACSC